MHVDGFKGKGLVNSYYKGDGTTGTLTSPEFTIEHSRQRADATIVKLPFFDPPRKRA